MVADDQLVVQISQVKGALHQQELCGDLPHEPAAAAGALRVGDSHPLPLPTLRHPSHGRIINHLNA